MTAFELFFTAPPGLEALLADEARDLGFAPVSEMIGGVETRGTAFDICKANLLLRGAGRVLVRVAHFKVERLSELDRVTASLPWRDWVKPETLFHVDATCHKSRIYHSGAAADRVQGSAERALGKGARRDGPTARIFVRISHDQCTISVDTSGELLHKRGYKTDVAKAPLRETTAALLLRACGYTGDEPLVDPMAGSGTLGIEAAQIACGLAPGRLRSFGMDALTIIPAGMVEELRAQLPLPRDPDAPIQISDKDATAVRAARSNAARAGVEGAMRIERLPVARVVPPTEDPGLFICNPPYGERLGASSELTSLYRSVGGVIRSRFPHWRVALLTSDERLADATQLPFAQASPSFRHGGLRVSLYQLGKRS